MLTERRDRLPHAAAESAADRVVQQYTRAADESLTDVVVDKHRVQNSTVSVPSVSKLQSNTLIPQVSVSHQLCLLGLRYVYCITSPNSHMTIT